MAHFQSILLIVLCPLLFLLPILSSGQTGTQGRQIEAADTLTTGDERATYENYFLITKLDTPGVDDWRLYYEDTLFTSIYGDGDSTIVMNVGDTLFIPYPDTLFTTIFGGGDSTRIIALGDTLYIEFPEPGSGGGGDTTYHWILQVNGANPDTIINNEVVNFVAGDNITITHGATNITIAADSCYQRFEKVLGALRDTLFLTDCQGTRVDFFVVDHPNDKRLDSIGVMNSGDSIPLFMIDTGGYYDTLYAHVPRDSIDTDTQSLTIDTTLATFTLSRDQTSTPDTLILPWKDAVRKDFSANYVDSITHLGYVGINQDTFPIYPMDVAGTDVFNTIQGRFRNTQNGVASIRLERTDSVLFDLQNWGSSYEIRRMDAGAGDQFVRLDTATHGRTQHYIRHDPAGYFWITDYGDGYHIPTEPDDWFYVLAPKDDGKVLEVPLPVFIDSLKVNGLVDSLAIIAYNGLTNQTVDSIKLGGFLVEDTHIKGQFTTSVTPGSGYQMNWDTLDRFNVSANRRISLATTRDVSTGIYNTRGFLILDNIVGNQLLFRNYEDNYDGSLFLAPDALELRFGDTTAAGQDQYGLIRMADNYLRIVPENQAELGTIDSNAVLISYDTLGSTRWVPIDSVPGSRDYDWLLIGSDRVPNQPEDIDSAVYSGTTTAKRVRIGQDSLENVAVLGVNGGVVPFQTWSTLSANQWRQFSRSTGLGWYRLQQSNDWLMQFHDTTTEPEDSTGTYVLFQGGYFGDTPLFSVQDGTVGFSQYPNTRVDGTVDSIQALYYPGAAGNINIAPIDSVISRLQSYDFDFIKLVGDTSYSNTPIMTMIPRDSADIDSLVWRGGVMRLGDTMFVKDAYDPAQFPGTFRATYPAQLQIADKQNATDFHGFSWLYDWRSITKGDWSFRLHNDDIVTDSVAHWYEIGVSSWYRPDPQSSPDTTYRQIFRISSRSNENAVVVHQDSIIWGDYDPASDIDSTIVPADITAMYVPQAGGVMKLAMMDSIASALGLAASTPTITMHERYLESDSIALNLNATVDTAFADLSWLKLQLIGDTIVQDGDSIYLSSYADSLGSVFDSLAIIRGTGDRSGYADAELTFDGGLNKLIVDNGGEGTSYFELVDNNDQVATFNKVVASSFGIMDFSVTPSDGTSAAVVRFNRNSNTTGSSYIDVMNASFVGARISGTNENGWVQASGGDFGVGTQAPSEKLDINGGLRIRTLSNEAFVNTLGINGTGVVKIRTPDELEADMGGPFQPAGSYDNYQNWQAFCFGCGGLMKTVTSGSDFTFGEGAGIGMIYSGGVFYISASDASASNEIQTPGYTQSTGVISLSLTGATATINQFTGTTRGLVPDDGGGLGSNYYLSAAGTWVLAAAGGGNGIYGGSGNISASATATTQGSGFTFAVTSGDNINVTNEGITKLQVGSTSVTLRNINGGSVYVGDTGDEWQFYNSGTQTRMKNRTSTGSSYFWNEDGGNIGVQASTSNSAQLVGGSVSLSSTSSSIDMTTTSTGDINLTGGGSSGGSIVLDAYLVDIDAGAGLVQVESFNFNSAAITAASPSLTATTGDLTLNSTSNEVNIESIHIAGTFIQHPSVGGVSGVELNAGGSVALRTLASGTGTATIQGNQGVTITAVSATNNVNITGRVGINRTPAANQLEVSGSVASKGTAGDWAANSDIRLKKNVNQIDSKAALDHLLKIRGVNFEWNDKSKQMGYQRPEGKQWGLIAQDIVSSFGEDNTFVYKDSEEYYMASYGTYDPLYIEAFRQIVKEKEALEERVDNLERDLRLTIALIKEIRK